MDAAIRNRTLSGDRLRSDIDFDWPSSNDATCVGPCQCDLVPKSTNRLCVASLFGDANYGGRMAEPSSVIITEMYQLLGSVRLLKEDAAVIRQSLLNRLDNNDWFPMSAAATDDYEAFRAFVKAEHDRLGESLGHLEERIANVIASSADASATIAEPATAAPFDGSSTPFRQPTPITTEWVYFNDAPNRDAARDGLAAFRRALVDLGAEEISLVGEPVFGSIWSTIKAVFSSRARLNDAKDHIQRVMAGTKSVDATANLIQAVSPEGADNVIVAEKNKLLVKRTNADGSTSLYVGPLNRRSYKQIQSHPEWFQTPERLPFLALEEQVAVPPPPPASTPDSLPPPKV